MASKRKRKKQQRAAQQGNGQQPPKTIMAAAIKEAQKKSEDQKKPGPNSSSPPAEKQEPEEDKKSKPKQKVWKKKTIIGFGSAAATPRVPSPKVHAICNIDNSPMCDSRIKGLEIGDKLSAEDIDCKNCLNYKAVKDLLELDQKTKPKESEEKPEEPETEEESETEDNSDEFESIRQMMDNRFKRMEKRLVKKLEEYCNILIKGKPTFFIVRKANNMFQIVHDLSRYVIVDNITEKDAEKLLQEYLSIEVKWDGQHKPDSAWLSAIRKIHEEYFKDSKKVEKPKSIETHRVLKRRSKPSIKRRKDRKPERRIIRRRKK